MNDCFVFLSVAEEERDIDTEIKSDDPFSVPFSSAFYVAWLLVSEQTSAFVFSLKLVKLTLINKLPVFNEPMGKRCSCCHNTMIYKPLFVFPCHS